MRNKIYQIFWTEKYHSLKTLLLKILIFFNSFFWFIFHLVFDLNLHSCHTFAAIEKQAQWLLPVSEWVKRYRKKVFVELYAEYRFILIEMGAKQIAKINEKIRIYIMDILWITYCRTIDLMKFYGHQTEHFFARDPIAKGKIY